MPHRNSRFWPVIIRGKALGRCLVRVWHKGGAAEFVGSPDDWDIQLENLLETIQTHESLNNLVRDQDAAYKIARQISAASSFDRSTYKLEKIVAELQLLGHIDAELTDPVVTKSYKFALLNVVCDLRSVLVARSEAPPAPHLPPTQMTPK